MSGSAQLHRDIGTLEARVDELNARLDRMEPKIDGMFEAITEARGGWQTLMWVGGAAGAIGAGVTSLVQKLKGGG